MCNRPVTFRCWLCVVATLALSGVLAIASLVQGDEKTKNRLTVTYIPPIYNADFEDAKAGGEATDWKPTDAKAWKIDEKDGNKFYSQFKASNYKPTHRSPFNYSLLKEAVIGDFV